MKVKTCTSCKEFVRISESYSGQLKVNNFGRKHACHPVVILDERDLGSIYRSVDSEIDGELAEKVREEHTSPDYVNLWKPTPDKSQK